ncbi:MAG: hypothetical protein PHQ58_05010 [Rhodoferax sp.]|uniref:hypothetical protein n=1 Tax=Rhodoferax sp. TaxID=50421 RepID=UPI002621F3A0|nr:hypothetical protein [Rhodoferax sp.]MDD2879774.1 hypothetical protein [Rhodoferax sp.]
MKHIRNAITSVRSMRGPAEGELLVDLQVNQESILGPSARGLFTAEQAVNYIKDHPRLEITPVEKWILD